MAGYHVGGKSGTSQKNQGIGVGDEEEEQKYISSFLGFAPADDPQIAVLVLLDTPTLVTNYGGKTPPSWWPTPSTILCLIWA